jgi:hypothetical protein
LSPRVGRRATDSEISAKFDYLLLGDGISTGRIFSEVNTQAFPRRSSGLWSAYSTIGQFERSQSTVEVRRRFLLNACDLLFAESYRSQTLSDRSGSTNQHEGGRASVSALLVEMIESNRKALELELGKTVR